MRLPEYVEYETDTTRDGGTVRLQSGNRSQLYRILMYIVLRDEGMFYDDLVDELAIHVPEGWAHARQEQKRRKTLEATPHVIHIGQRDVARKYINAAKRNHRIDVRRNGYEAKRVWLDTPPASGGLGQYHIDWAYEWNALEDVHLLLHPDEPFVRRATRVEGAGSRDGEHA